MKTKSFLQFVGPSVVLMLLLLAVPMATTFYLSVRNCTLDMEIVKVEQSSPFGKTETITQRARLDASGRAIQACGFVGLDYYRKVLGLEASPAPQVMPLPPDAGGVATTSGPKVDNEFFGALRFTLIYTFVTLPFVLVIGFLLALAVNGVTQRLKSV